MENIILIGQASVLTQGFGGGRSEGSFKPNWGPKY